MNCSQCEELMSDYLEGTISAADESQVRLHLSGCIACTELLEGIRAVITSAKSFPVYEAPAWLPTRIVANTPRVAREGWLDTIGLVWKWLIEPRTAVAVFTAVLVCGWIGSLAGISPDWAGVVKDPVSVYYRFEGTVSRAYDGAIRSYYRSPLVTRIETQIEQLREIS